MSRYCEICLEHDDTGIGICSECASEGYLVEEEKKENSDTLLD